MFNILIDSKRIDFSNFDLSKEDDMPNIFAGFINLKNIGIG